jgi:signal peptidase I
MNSPQTNPGNFGATSPEAARLEHTSTEASVAPSVDTTGLSGTSCRESQDTATDSSGSGTTAGAEELPETEKKRPAESREKRRSGDFLGSVQSLAITVVIAVFVITFVVQAFQIPSESMEDTLLIGDYLLVDKVHFGHGGIWGKVLPYSEIHRGDIIVFRYPVHPQQHFVKRVIGLPGDHIRMKNKEVFVNGKQLRENYVIYRSSLSDIFRDDFPRLDLLNANVEARWWLQMRSLVQNGELIVPVGRYFVLGDNRDESLDSRYWGLVPRENIIGRPLLIYWSMKHPERLGRVADTAGDKLLYFAYAVTHLFQETRWNRTFRLIR